MHEKKSDTQVSKMPTTQPFKPNTQVLNSQRPSISNLQKKVTRTNQTHPKRISANTSRVSSTQNLFKPNPNFANIKNKQTT